MNILFGKLATEHVDRQVVIRVCPQNLIGIADVPNETLILIGLYDS